MDRETRERLRQQQAGKPATTTGPSPEVADLGKPRQLDDNHPIRHKCGHTLTVGDYKKVKCPKCQAADRKRMWDKVKEKKRLRDGHMAHARLPDKSTMEMTYHAIDDRNGKWTGTLTVFNPDGTVQFQDTRSVKSLLNLAPLLDQKYRRWLHEKDNPPQPPPGEE